MTWKQETPNFWNCSGETQPDSFDPQAQCLITKHPPLPVRLKNISSISNQNLNNILIRSFAVSFCCKGIHKYDKQSWNARENTERLKFQDFNICPNIILYVEGNTDLDTYSRGIAIFSALKCSHAKNVFYML